MADGWIDMSFVCSSPLRPVHLLSGLVIIPRVFGETMASRELLWGSFSDDRFEILLNKFIKCYVFVLNLTFSMLRHMQS